MKIEILEPSGYCSGVNRAIELAISARKENPLKRICVLGKLVHNNDALQELSKMNIETLDNDMSVVDSLSDDTIVILTAHGHDKNIENILNKKNIKFIDATCPFVKQALRIITNAINTKKEVIYIGKKNHPEANAALSISNKVHLIDINEKFDPSITNDKNPLVISQTTFSDLEVNALNNEIKSNIPNATIHNGVCNASTSRQKALLSLPKDVELIYVVGGKNSNNTKTLFNLAKKNFPNAKVLMIENKNEINKKDLIGLNYIAISSGASTPSSIISDIKLYIESLCN